MIHTRKLKFFIRYTKKHTGIYNLLIHEYTIHEFLIHELSSGRNALIDLSDFTELVGIVSENCNNL